MEILNTVLKGRCDRIKREEGYPYVLLQKIEIKDVSYLNSLFDCFENSLKEEILTKDNYKFFEEQIKTNDDYIDFISETDCIKKTLPVTDMPIPINCDSRCFKVSNILYTKDYKYAIFITSSMVSTISIYILKNGKYVPYRGCITSMS